jgi:tetratricopeptide (TPR) repeat protein
MKRKNLADILHGNFDKINDPAVFASASQFATAVRWSILLRKTVILDLIGSLDKATVIADECALMAERSGIKKLMADSYLSLSEIRSDAGDFEAVMTSSKRALVLFQKIGDVNGQAWAFNQLARAHSFLGEPGLAADEHNQAEALFQKTDNLEGLAYTYNNLAIKYWRDGDVAKAKQYFEQALGFFEKLGMKQQISLGLNNVGTVFQRIGEYEKSDDYFDRALRIRKEVGDKRGIATCMNNLGMNDMLQGNLRRAIARFNESLRIREETGEIKETGVVLSNMANAYSKLGDYAKAFELYGNARIIKKRMGDEYSLAITDVYLALTTIEAGNREVTEDIMAELEQINERLHNQEINARLNETKLMLKLELGMPPDRGFKQRLADDIAIAEKNNLQVRVATLKMILGRFCTMEKNLPYARGALEDALVIFRKLKDVYNQGRVLYYLGRVQAEEGMSAEAEGTLEEALAIFRRIEATVWTIRVTSLLQRFQTGQ